MVVHESHFTSQGEPLVEKYRPLSASAVIALVLGLISPVGVFAAYLLVVPLAGAAVAMTALARIANSEDAYSGRRLAVIGLLFSLYFGGWGIAQHWGTQWMIARQARACTDGWLQLLVEDKPLDAFRWNMAPEQRIAPGLPLAEFYAQNAEPRRAAEQFLSIIPFPTDMQSSSLKSFRYLGNESITMQELGDQSIENRYEVTFEKDGETRTEKVNIRITRIPTFKEGEVHWVVNDIRVVEPKANQF